MKKVFLDTNILLNYGQQRDRHEEAEAIFCLGDMGEIEIFASYLFYANMGYILRDMEREAKYALESSTREGITVLPCDDLQLDAALNHHVKDYEDMLQYQCALAAGCDVIVTNNKKDFYEFCQLPFLTSEEFLLQFDYSETPDSAVK